MDVDLKAALDARLDSGAHAQMEYETLLAELALLRVRKVQQYGSDRYHEPDAEWAMIMVYSDIYRKGIRLKQLAKSASSDPDAATAMRDTLMDLANYAVMGVQEIDRFRLRGGEGDSV